jgi:hypothetical protein
MKDTQLINIPFAGFYDSMYDAQIDSAREFHAENELDRQREEKIAPALESSDFDAILFDCADYGKMHQALARQFLERFTDRVSDMIGIPLVLSFAEMTSPREYNFETDRIFAHVPMATVQAMYDAVDRDVLAEEISERFTSRSGFISFYSNGAQDWHDKPLTAWDANELGTLLRALIRQHADDPETAENDTESAILDDMCDKSDFSDALETCTDWTKFDTLVSEKRATLTK